MTDNDAGECLVTITRQHLLDEAARMDMHYIHSQFYTGGTKQTFMRDLSEKEWVISASQDGVLVAFTTIQVIHSNMENREMVFVFSGDTIVHPDHWQANLIAPAFGEFIYFCSKEYEGLPVYWNLISKGYRTYRLLPVYFREFYPVYDRKTPGDKQALLDHISVLKFGSYYDRETGIISFNGSRDRMNDRINKIIETKKRNPHINFFLEKNPGYINGDELACIAPMHPDNLTPLAFRIMEHKAARWIT